jgi:hypothetical protein
VSAATRARQGWVMPLAGGACRRTSWWGQPLITVDSRCMPDSSCGLPMVTEPPPAHSCRNPDGATVDGPSHLLRLEGALLLQHLPLVVCANGAPELAAAAAVLGLHRGVAPAEGTAAAGCVRGALVCCCRCATLLGVLHWLKVGTPQIPWAREALVKMPRLWKCRKQCRATMSGGFRRPINIHM